MKNGFEEVLTLNCNTTVTIGGVMKKTGVANPTEIEGYFIGSKEVADKYSGVGYLHVLVTAEGNVGVWGKPDLNSQLLGIKPGQYIGIEFAGFVATGYPNPKFTYKIGVKKGDILDVSSLEAAAAASSSFSEEDADEESTETRAKYDSGGAYPTPAAKTYTTATDADNKARTKALLEGRNK